MAGQTTEIRLLRASLKGSGEAFEAIIKKYQSLICAITYSATGNLDKSEELAQQAFVNAWKNLDQLKDLASFRNWLCSITRSIIRNYFRSQKRDIISRAAPIEKAAPELPDNFEPVEIAINHEQQQVIRRALKQIPESYREPLVLYYREQKSLRQVAEQLQLSEAAARQRISRGRAMLKEQVAAMVETTIMRNGPTAAFTVAVVASIGAMAVGTSGATAAAISTTGVAGTGSTVTAAASGLTAKILAVAAALAIGTAAVITYRHVTSKAKQPQPIRTVHRAPTIAQPDAPAPLDRIDVGTNVIPDNTSVNAKSVIPTEGSSPWRNSNTDQPPPAPTDTQTKEFVFEPKGVLSGLITDAETNEPVVGARVQISKPRRYTSVTDENGFYHIDKINEDGDYKVRIRSTEYLWVSNWSEEPVLTLKNDTRSVRHFALKPGCQIDVDIVDEQGKPIEDTRLFVSWMGTKYGRELERERWDMRTDCNGQATLGAFEPSDVDYLITAMHDGYAPAKYLVKLTDPNLVEYGAIVMQEGIDVEGYAEYSDGVAAEGLRIEAKPDWWNIVACMPFVPIDANGRFVLSHVAPAKYTIYVNTPDRAGGGPGESRPVMQIDLPPETGVLAVRVPGDSPSRNISISGTIDYLGDKKPRDVSVSAFSAFTGSRTGNVRGNEFAVGSLDPGVYTLVFSGRNIEPKVVRNVRAPSTDVHVRLEYQTPPRLTGSVVQGDDRSPVRQFKARAMKLKGFRSTSSFQSEKWSSFDNAQGKFDLEATGPGVYQVQIKAEGYAPAWSQEIDTDQNQPVVISLSAGGSIRGKVIDEQGRPISGAKVLALSRAGGGRLFDKDVFITNDGAVETVNGLFVIPNVPEGWETIKVTHPQYCHRTITEIEVFTGKATEDAEIILNKGAIVEGYVYDEDGNPQANELLYFQDARTYRYDSKVGRLASPVTDANGFYQATHLPENLCYVRRAKYGRLGVLARTVMPTQGEVVHLDFGGQPLVTGQIIIGGEPLANTKLLIGDAHSTIAAAFECHVTTDEQGGFAVGGVPAGRYGIYYKLPQSPIYTSEDWLKVTTFDVDGDDLDLGLVNVETGSALVSVTYEQWHDAFAHIDIYLQKGSDPWGPRPGNVVRSPTPDQPYLIADVPVGSYMLVARRPDNVFFMKAVQIKAGPKEAAFSLRIPKCTATVSGALLSEPQEALFLSDSKGSVLAYIHSFGAGTYTNENLPAGEYRIGSYYTMNTAPLASFSLDDGQTRNVDIDPSVLSSLNR